MNERTIQDMESYIAKLESDNSALHTRIDGLERRVRELMSSGVYAEINSSMERRNGELNREVEKLQADLKLQSDIIVQHDSVNTQLREMAKELESKFNKLQAADHCIAHTDESIQTILNENQTLKAQNDELKKVNERQRLELISENDRLERNTKLEHENQELVVKVVELKSAAVAATNILVEIVLMADYRDDQKLLECLQSARKALNKALSTPTGSKLLAKIEAGEKMNLALQLVKDQILGGDLDVVDYVRVGINSALAAYRAACVGGGE